MAANRKELERELELAVVDVLEQDYDLDVRLGSDSWNRRRKNVATLQFQYHWQDNAPRAKVVIGIDGDAATSHVLMADFSDSETIERCAEDCEALALSVHAWLEKHREREGNGAYQRRWDD